MRKSRKSIVLLGLLVMALVINIGFAAWVIIAPTADANKEGSIKVETVQDQSWQFSTTWCESTTITKDDDNKDVLDKLATDPMIVFGTPKGVDQSDMWLQNTTIGEENLVAYLYVKASPASDEAVSRISDSYMTFTISDSDFGAAVTKGVIANPTIQIGTGEAVTHTDDKTVYTLTAQQLKDGVFITITFKWGTNGNPYTHYNAIKNPIDTDIASAKGDLEELAKLENAKFTLKISVTNPAAGK